MTCRFVRLLCLLVGALGAPELRAELRLAAPFQAHMVLQRGAPIHVHGAATPGAAIRVTFDGEEARATADPQGRWRVTLGARESSVLPRSLLVEGDGGSVRLEDVLIGDVWILAVADEDDPTPRAARTPRAVPGHVRFCSARLAAPTDDVVWTAAQRSAVAAGLRGSPWRAADESEPESVSSTAWSFALSLEEAQHAPLGVIQLATESAPLESWLPRPALLSEARLAARLVGWWDSEAVAPEVRSRARRNLAGLFDHTPTAPDGGAHPFQPGYLWQHGLGPLRGFSFAGVIFSCGTEAREAPDLHEHLLRRLILAWREHVVGASPFLLIESTGRDFFLDRTGTVAALRRDAERRIASGPGSLPRVGLVVTHDLTHTRFSPEERYAEIGARLATWALGLVHERVGVVASGPQPVSYALDPKARTSRIAFDFGDGLRTADGGAPSGFSVLTADGRALPADAAIESGELVLAHPAVAFPLELRYGFDTNGSGNLVNRAGLPAPTFRLIVAESRVVEASGAGRGFKR